MTTKAEEYRRLQTAEPEIVTLKAPSGFEFQFKKPSKYDLIFNMGRLPVAAASRAVEKWKEQGVLSLDEDDPATEDQVKLIKTVFDLRDRVLSLSHSPKLVVGKADEDKDEISTTDVSDEDLEFLFAFVASGGNASSQLATFSGGVGAGARPRPNRKSRRAAAK